MRIQLASCHPETQRLKAEHTILEHQVRIEVGERQVCAVHNAFAGEFDIGIHLAPALGAELFDRQHFTRRLFACTAPGLLLGVGVRSDQGPQVSHQQLIGHQRPAQLGPRLSGDIVEAAMNVAVANLAVEVFIGERCTTRLMQFGNQVTIGGIGWRIRQCHAGQRIQIAQAVAGQFQAQIQRPQVERIGQGSGQRDPGVGNAHLGLQRERFVRVLQGQQTANFAGAIEFLAVVLALHLQGECIVLRPGAFYLSLFRRSFTDDFIEGDRFAQRVDQHIQPGFKRLVI